MDESTGHMATWRNERQRHARREEKRRARARKAKIAASKTCPACGVKFQALRAIYCSPACRPKYVPSGGARVKANARRRTREHRKRSALSDITPEQELEMRKVRRCPLCRAWMTGKPNLPNSKHLDHIVPICVGGTHTHGNVRIICAACNLKRPKDGSDYSGPVTLWAQGEIPVGRPDRRHDRTATWVTCRNGLHTWTPENIKITSAGKKMCRPCLKARERKPCLRMCGCGTPFAAPGGTLMCPDCTLTAVRKAAYLRLADRLTWNEIATQVGYASGTGIRDAVARRMGGNLPGLNPPKVTPVRPPGRRCACGGPLGKGRITCEGCVEKRAWRAVGMRRSGMTLREIADTLGCNSVTTVTNLMKTVVPIESRMGRPSHASISV